MELWWDCFYSPVVVERALLRVEVGQTGISSNPSMENWFSQIQNKMEVL